MVFEYATRLSSLLSTTANENDGRGQYPSSAISAESTKDRRIRRPSLPIYSIKLFSQTAGDPLCVSNSDSDFVDFVSKVSSDFDLIIQRPNSLPLSHHSTFTIINPLSYK